MGPAKRANTRLATSWRSALVAVMIVPALLTGCTTLENGLGPDEGEPRLLVQPLRTIGLARHHVDLALGRHSRGVGPAAEIAPNALTNVERACSGGRPSVTWLGHSSVILDIGGRCILTDPVLEENISPVSPLPVRLVESPVRVDDLPEIDAIIISHGDYDHLHLPTIRALSRRFPDAEVLVPPGVAGPVTLAGYPRVTRLRLDETKQIQGLSITAARAHHETRRTPAALRTGEAFSWIVTDGRKKVLFVGDTGYGPAFSAIGRTHGPFDLLLVPIGAYEPRELVAHMHANPEEAAQIASEVEARLAIGIHWGTFALSPDRPEDSVRRFMEAGRKMDVNTRVLEIGGSISVP